MTTESAGKAAEAEPQLCEHGNCFVACEGDATFVDAGTGRTGIMVYVDCSDCGQGWISNLGYLRMRVAFEPGEGV